MNYLSIEDGVLTLRGNPRECVIATSLPEVEAVLARNPEVMCSSSIDFPDEHTDNPYIIKFCEALRGGTWFPPEGTQGDETNCPHSPHGGHEPDLSTVNAQSDGGDWYLDVNCLHCGRSGCLANLSALLKTTSPSW